MRILTVNAGSSNVKLGLFQAGAGRADPVRLASAQARQMGGRIELVSTQGERPAATIVVAASSGGLELDVLAALDATWSLAGCAAVGHRIVHGGPNHRRPVRLEPGVRADLQALSGLAPLHQSAGLAWVEAVSSVWPTLDQVASFDTAFHAAMPPVAQRFALPRELHDAGIRRYGFHGLSYASIGAQLRQLAPELVHGRVVVAHLGSGSSACAMLDGHSVDTTMGFSALDGLPMATRCGALDPGVVLHLLEHHGLQAQALSDLLYRRSGLLGVSGESGDLRDLLASASAAAAEAVELFVHRCAQQVAGLACSMGGLDGVVFTGGVGEHQAPIRAAIADALAWLGLRVDPAANQDGRQRFDAEGSSAQLWRLPSQEDVEIARGTLDLLVGARVRP